MSRPQKLDQIYLKPAKKATTTAPDFEASLQRSSSPNGAMVARQTSNLEGKLLHNRCYHCPFELTPISVVGSSPTWGALKRHLFCFWGLQWL